MSQETLSDFVEATAAKFGIPGVAVGVWAVHVQPALFIRVSARTCMFAKIIPDYPNLFR